MLIEPTYAKAEDISTHGMSNFMEDAITKNGDGKTTDIQFTSHNTNQISCLSNAHAVTHSQNFISHEDSEKSSAVFRFLFFRKRESFSD